MAHDHSHAHDHHHDHGDDNMYFTQQLFTLAAAGALAIAMISMWYTGRLKWMLADTLQIVTLAGGLALLAIVVLRAMVVWKEVDRTQTHSHDEHEHAHTHDQAHDHAHVHHEGCDHDHGHGHSHNEQVATAPAVVGLSLGTAALSAPPAPPVLSPSHGHSHHGHDHDHDHAWAPWQYVLIFLPVALFLLGVPNDTFKGDGKGIDASQLENIGSATGSGERTELPWSHLERAADILEERNRLEGKTITLTGRYAGDDQAFFTLIRYKMNCCAADAIPLNIVIKVDYSQLEAKKLNYKKLSPSEFRNDWVEVTGRIHFVKKKSDGRYMTALIITPTATSGPESLDSSEGLIKRLDSIANPYVN